ncbi:MAG: enoyl-CoA hydratase-related protein [Nakamurella sp.]
MSPDFDAIYESSTDTIVTAARGGSILVLTLNRPDRLNAWNQEMQARYFDLLDAADDDPRVRAVIVTGAGRAFCAGADLADLQHVASMTAEGLESWLRPDRPLAIRKPLIGAINGATVGFGLVQALYCDVRIGCGATRFATAFTRRGLIAEFGVSALLSRAIGHGRAVDLLLSGRMVEADEALRIGLLTHVADDTSSNPALTAALAYATDLVTNCSPRSLALIKEQLRADTEGAYQAATAHAADIVLDALRSPDAAEGVTSFVELRPPNFPPLPPRT